MIVQVASILSGAEVEALRESLRRDDIWEEGAKTAAGRARAVKSNEQGHPDAPAVKAAIEKARRAILSSEAARAAALPERFARLIVSRTRAGMGYGDHVDAPYIEGCRTDVSFTLFLSDAAAYDGGELVIASPGAEDEFRLAAGDAVFYPSSSVHRVSQVTRGERLAIVGWIRSQVRDADARRLIFDLSAAIADVERAGATGPALVNLQNVRNNLIRKFGD